MRSVTRRCWWIPLIVARHASFKISTGPKAVIGNAVYVGPFGNALGFIWGLLGKPTEDC